MPIKDLEKRRKADRDRKRRKRAAKKRAVIQEVSGGRADTLGGQKAISDPPKGEPANVAELQAIIGEQIQVVRVSGLDPLLVGRTISALAGAFLKAAETGQIEERLEALESETETLRHSRRVS